MPPSGELVGVPESLPVVSPASSVVATGASVEAALDGLGLLDGELELEHPGAAARRADGRTAPATRRAKVEGSRSEMRKPLKGCLMQRVVARSAAPREAPRGHFTLPRRQNSLRADRDIRGQMPLRTAFWRQRYAGAMTDAVSFEHQPGFEQGELSGQVTLGKFEAHYEEIFAEVIEDGVITVEE